MGNGVSMRIVFDNHGEDSNIFQCQDQVNGHVEIIVHHQTQNTKNRAILGSVIEVELVGFESTYEGRGRCELARELKTFAHDRQGKVVGPGRYRYSFQFNLAPDLPASVQHQTSKGEFKIEYMITAKASDCPKKFNDLREIQLYTRPPHASESVKAAPYLPRPKKIVADDGGEGKSTTATGPTLVPIKHLGFTERGSRRGGAGMYFAVAVDKNQIGKGEVLTTAVACRNHSSTPCMAVNVRLIERKWWSVKDSSPQQKTRRHKTIDRVVLEQLDVEFPESNNLLRKEAVPRGKRRKNRARHTDSEDETKDIRIAMQAEIQEALLQMNRRVKFIIPKETICDTYDGAMIKICHVFQAECIMKGGVTTNKPMIEIPLIVTETAGSLAGKLPARRISTSSRDNGTVGKEIAVSEEAENPASPEQWRPCCGM